jgi:DNA-binding transcriptional MerR regulator
MDVRLTIGDLARWAGTTTRTVRHYHRKGVLPEPPRTSGGYRSYGLRDVARLVRARRLVGLGLPLARVAQLLDDRADLTATLKELDADLERDEARIRARREAVRSILGGGAGEAAARVERLRSDLVEAFGRTPLLDGELAVLEVVAHEAPDLVPALEAVYRAALADSGTRARSAALATALEELARAERAGEELQDRVDALAGELAELVRAMTPQRSGGVPGAAPEIFASLVQAELTPAQGEVLRRARTRLEAGR